MIRPAMTALLIVAIAAGLAVASAALPDDPYQRWSSFGGTVFDETRWIYERCHFDPTPIDVAIIGNSRVRQGIDAPLMEQDLAQRGIRAHVVNFSIVTPGRGSDYAILHEVVTTKHPRLIILGVSERQNRNAHPAYKYLAPTSMIISGLPWRNEGYVPDLLYLPYRQLKLFADRVFPGEAGLPTNFDRARYKGPSIETTGSMPLEGSTVQDLTRPASEEALESEAGQIRERRPSFVSRISGPLADAQSARYLTLMSRMAHTNGSQIVFLFVPSFEGPVLEDPAIYKGLGPIWSAAFLSRIPGLWGSAVHLTSGGAAVLTHRLSIDVAKELGAPPSKVRSGPAPTAAVRT
jgi:hypothetical protein